MAKLQSVLLGVALVAGCGAGIGQAATMQAVFGGTVYDSSDLRGIFGGGGTLDGERFRAVFTYDPDTPGIDRTTTADFDTFLGGSLHGLPAGMRSARLTINGRTQSLETGYNGGATAEDPGSFSGVSLGVSYEAKEQRIQTFKQMTMHATGEPGLFLADLEASVPLTALGPILSEAFGDGQFILAQRRQNSEPFFCLAEVCTSGRLSPTSVRIAPIPVPAALPLLAVGLAALGFAGLRRRRDSEPAPAV